MDLLVSDLNPVEVGEQLHFCGFCDLEVLQKMATILLRGLACACVDNTKGDLFNGPASVALDVRKEMVDFLTRRSKTYTAECVSKEHDVNFEYNDGFIETFSGLVDEFTILKRNLLSRFWSPSESRENKIASFFQEMEANGFWKLHDRVTISEVLLRYMDSKKEFHCAMNFHTREQLAEHKTHCAFRPVNCINEGCKGCFCAFFMEKHDSECPFKILPCKQNCPQSIMRHEMYRHCTTVCPMKIVNCPFYKAGCESAFSQCTLEQHLSEFLNKHLICVLRIIYRQEESIEDLKDRVLLLEKSQSLNERSEALDVRLLNLAIKEQEAKMKNLESNLSNVSQRSTLQNKEQEAKMKKLESNLSNVNQRST